MTNYMIIIVVVLIKIFQIVFIIINYRVDIIIHNDIANYLFIIKLTQIMD